MQSLRIAVLAVLLPVALAAQTTASTYDAVLQGMACRQNPAGRMDCEYRVGGSLRFVIAGVGQEDAAISFFKVDSIGDHYASVAALHGCVVIKPWRQNRDSISTFAFVSPKDGKVYRTWQTCHKFGKR